MLHIVTVVETTKGSERRCFSACAGNKHLTVFSDEDGVEHVGEAAADREHRHPDHDVVDLESVTCRSGVKCVSQLVQNVRIDAFALLRAGRSSQSDAGDNILFSEFVINVHGQNNEVRFVLPNAARLIVVLPILTHNCHHPNEHVRSNPNAEHGGQNREEVEASPATTSFAIRNANEDRDYHRK